MKFSPIEKMCLAHIIHLVAKIDPVKYVLSRAIMSRWLAKWAVAFQEFEIAYVP